ncbi:MAG: bifunctional homocysteine S-methyltransferase/methylenetetrahydrofolate reductase [Chloroflexota bacterium]|nr:bifunctional homocysteine S-methyltransferase/methylenetetrahydrofolate reductase [Chloroflexota bacterium]
MNDSRRPGTIAELARPARVAEIQTEGTCRTMAHPLIERLNAGVVLGDGAMGTMLFDAGHASDECLESLNASDPETVAAIHRQYIGAGADVIEANTFGGNRFRLAAHGLQNKVRDFNKRGVRLVREEREISGTSVLVAGSIGPSGRTIEPFGVLSRQEATEGFREQIEFLLEAGVDLLVIETMGSLGETECAIDAARACSDLPIVAMMTFAEDGRTLSGREPEEVVRELAARRIVVIGANCSVGPQRMLNVLRKMSEEIKRLPEGSSAPFLACMPNAGWPTRVGSRIVYRSSPEYFADFAKSAVEAGARLIGGCCGTTPLHIAAMRTVIDEINAASGTAMAEPATVPAPGTRRARPAIIMETDDTTDLHKKLGKTFLKCVEVDPPKGLNPHKALEGARLLKSVGVHAINVADSPMARVRMSAMTLCYLIQHEVGVETIIHFTTRDRSLMGLQSELLGAHAAGVRNILALTGDPPSLGMVPASSGVFDVDSIGLVRIIKEMNDGADASGASIGRSANFTIACAVDPNKPDLEDEASRLRQKIEAGANFVMTQPIFDASVWTNFLNVFGAERLPIPVMIGILPLQSSKHAEFLHNEVPGINPTENSRERMRLAGANGRSEGVRMAQDLLQQLVPHAEGVYLMPSFGRYEVAAEVLDVLQT